MVSSLTEQGAGVTLQALELGAVDFVTKPKVDMAHRLDDYAREICEKVRIAARARVQDRAILQTGDFPVRRLRGDGSPAWELLRAV